MNKKALAVIASLALVALESTAAQITFACHGKVKEVAPLGTAFYVGADVTDVYVFDEADNTLLIGNREKVKVQATPSAIAARIATKPGTVLTISISRATGGYVTTLTKT